MRGRLIDHAGTKQRDLNFNDEHGQIKIPVGSLTPEYLDGTLKIEVVRNRIRHLIRTPELAESCMVFSLGKSLSDMFNKKDSRFQALKNLAANMKGNVERKNLATLQEEFAAICKTDKRFEIEILIAETKNAINQNDEISLKPLRLKLLDAIEQYLRSVKTLSDERFENCRAFINKIADISINDREGLFSSMHEFLQDRKKFSVGFLHRSKLRKLIFDVFHEEFDVVINQAKDFYKKNKDKFSDYHADQLNYLFKQSTTSNINDKNSGLVRITKQFFDWNKEKVEWRNESNAFTEELHNQLAEYEELERQILEEHYEQQKIEDEQREERRRQLSDLLELLQREAEEKAKLPLLAKSVNCIMNECRAEHHYGPKKSVLFDITAKKFKNLANLNLNYRDIKTNIEAYDKLVKLIRDTELEQLPGALDAIQNFPDPELINCLKELLQPEIIAIDLRRLNDDANTLEAVLPHLIAQEHGTKLKRGEVFQLGNRSCFFSRSVEVVKLEENSENKSFFIPSRKFNSEFLSGSFASVKQVEKFAVAEQNIVYDETKWVRKKLKERNVQELFDEYRAACQIAPSLGMHFPVEQHKFLQDNALLYKDKLFMRYGGQDLAKFPKDKLDTERVRKILKDIAEQANRAYSHGIFLSDIKPENIVYDYEKNEAVIIDLVPGYCTKKFLAPEDTRDIRQSNIDRSKLMVYAIGISLQKIVKNQEFSQDFQDIINRMTESSPDTRASLEEVIQFADRIIAQQSHLRSVNSGCPLRKQ